MIEQQDLEERLRGDLEPQGFLHSPKGSGAEGWKVFLFQGHGEAALMWARSDDRANVEAGVERDLDDQHLRTSNLEKILAVLTPLGYGVDMAFLGGTPRITITRVPA
ncbi:hypothetical protein ACFRNJ_12380 [Streptomyces sp. NPDC056721]|uniref:hypothetical protein n=1 Tax=Streptomyces sp. NPDC056721 TaxID=3345923 RepID=UPI00368A3B31